MKYCSNCGRPLQEGAMFCGNCGKPIDRQTTTGSVRPEPATVKGSSDNSWVNHLSDYVGNDKPVNLNWKVLFSDVMTKHTLEDAEEIFIVGTPKTTPPVEEVSKDWPHPWLYSRVFLMFFVTFALLWICCSVFGNPNALPGLIVVGSFTVPLSTVVLFLELNAWRNISLYEVMKTFFVGGGASLVATLFLFSFVGAYDLSFFGAFLTGVVEETGKAIIVYYFLRRMENLTILNGMLIGAAVGAGFAAFESSGYAMNFLFQGGWDVMMDVIFLRGFLTPGGHVVWAAISGAGLVMASKALGGDMSISVLTNQKFLRLFVIVVLLHALWDSPLASIGQEVYLIPIALTLAAWVVVMILINMGLAEVSETQSGK